MQKRENKIKVGYCVAYDWKLLKYSIPLIYDYADEICLSIDVDRISWSGNKFSWNELDFRILIAQLDPLGKISILEEDYHLSNLSPMENEVRQRNKIASFLGKDGWHIQLDTDEFFINFKGFVDFLQTIKARRKVNISCPWITLYKQNDKGFFYVEPNHYKQVEFIQIATQHPEYEYGRRNGNFNIHTNFAILHLSWARSEKEIWEKLNNWGHKNDFDIQAYFDKWKNLNEQNFHEYKNFHHVHANAWPKLGFIPSRNIEELLNFDEAHFVLPITKMKLTFENSIWYSRIKKVLKLK